MSESKYLGRVPINLMFGLPDDEYAGVREPSDRRHLDIPLPGRASLVQFRLRNDSQRRVCISARTERPLGRGPLLNLVAEAVIQGSKER